jgi:hypothetical protein
MSVRPALSKVSDQTADATRRSSLADAPGAPAGEDPEPTTRRTWLSALASGCTFRHWFLLPAELTIFEP